MGFVPQAQGQGQLWWWHTMWRCWFSRVQQGRQVGLALCNNSFSLHGLSPQWLPPCDLSSCCICTDSLHSLHCYMKTIPAAKPLFFMGRFSLQAEATSPALVHVFVKPPQAQGHVFLLRGDVQVCVGQAKGLGEGLPGLGVPTRARGGDAPCPSPAGTP